MTFVNSNFYQTSILFYMYLQIITSIVICHVLYFKNIKAQKALKEHKIKKIKKKILIIVLQLLNFRTCSLFNLPIVEEKNVGMNFEIHS